MAKPNIILITLDACRADHLGVYGYKKNTTPFLDSLAKKGVVFKHAYSTGAATPQAFPGIMTSTYPMDFEGYSDVSKGRTLISETLRKSGYHTLGFHSNAYLSNYFGYGRGWDIFSYLNYFGDITSRPSMRVGTWQSKAIKKFNAAKRWLKENSPFGEFPLGFVEQVITSSRKIIHDFTGTTIPAYFTAFEMNAALKKELPDKPEKPFFLWMHYMDAHAPYGLFLRKGYGLFARLKSQLTDYLFDFLCAYPLISRIFNRFYISLYDSGIRNIDNAIKDLFEYLSSIGVSMDDTFVFITADHGEEFGEYGDYQHPQALFNANIKVPLIIVAPKNYPTGNVSKIPRSSIDIAPTILDMAGIPKPKTYRGKNLLDAEERDIIVEISEHQPDLSGVRVIGEAIIAEGYKLIKAKGESMLFSIDDLKDKNNKYEEKKDIVSDLERRLKNHRPK